MNDKQSKRRISGAVIQIALVSIVVTALLGLVLYQNYDEHRHLAATLTIPSVVVTDKLGVDHALTSQPQQPFAGPVKLHDSSHNFRIVIPQGNVDANHAHEQHGIYGPTSKDYPAMTLKGGEYTVAFYVAHPDHPEGPSWKITVVP